MDGDGIWKPGPLPPRARPISVKAGERDREKRYIYIRERVNEKVRAGYINKGSERGERE